MSPADIVAHLDERFRLLTGGRRGRVERHQTMRAAIEWSYSLLGDTERAVFDCLGVFPSSFDEAAAVGASIGCGHTGRDASGFPVHRSLDEAVRMAERHRATVLWGVAGFVRRIEGWMKVNVSEN